MTDRRLDVPAAEVVDAVGGWVAAERGVGPVVVIAVEPGREGGDAVGAGVVGGGVGPLDGQGAVEPFGLAAGPRAEGFDRFVGCADIGQGRREWPAAGLGEGVVGHYP